MLRALIWHGGEGQQVSEGSGSAGSLAGTLGPSTPLGPAPRPTFLPHSAAMCGVWPQPAGLRGGRAWAVRHLGFTPFRLAHRTWVHPFARYWGGSTIAVVWSSPGCALGARGPTSSYPPACACSIAAVIASRPGFALSLAAVPTWSCPLSGQQAAGVVLRHLVDTRWARSLRRHRLPWVCCTWYEAAQVVLCLAA